MTLLALILAAAAASVSSAPSPTTSGWISGDTLTTIISILAGAGGLVGGKMWGDRAADKKLAKQEDVLRTQIANELRAKILNDPLHIEQSGFQASMKNNEKDHTDLFNRLRVLEADVSGIKATITAKFDGLSAQIMETREMVRSLYDKVCNGKRK